MTLATQTGSAALLNEYRAILDSLDRGKYSSMTVLYVDIRLTTRVTIDPIMLRKLACRITVTKPSHNWDRLKRLLEEQNPVTAEGARGEVRLGIELSGENHEDGIFVAALYERSPEYVLGIVNGQTVNFHRELPAGLTSFIQDQDCKKP